MAGSPATTYFLGLHDFQDRAAYEFRELASSFSEIRVYVVLVIVVAKYTFHSPSFLVRLSEAKELEKTAAEQLF